jgi:predicted MPP superfamily phosphohydrolase
MRQLLMRWTIRFIFPAYIGIHVYAYVQYTITWTPDVEVRILLGIWLTFMILSLFFIRHLEMIGRYRKLAIAVAWTSYTWMGFIFLFFFVSLSTQFFISVIQLVSALQDFKTQPILIEPFTIAFGLSLGLSVYGLWRAAWPCLVRISLQSPHLPLGICLRLVQISDLHLGLVPTPLRLRRLVRLIEAVSPDVLVSTGDFTDLRTDQFCPALADMATLKAPLGKYAVTGNHECYAGLIRSEQVLRKAGFILLRQRWVSLMGAVQIAGVDDPVAVGGRPHLEEEALCNTDQEKFTVLLKHRPELEPSVVDRIDLQLSGHTHDGQIFPFTLLPRLFYQARPGLTQFGRAALYLNRGTGTWGPPMRFPFAPEVTLFEIEGKG